MSTKTSSVNVRVSPQLKKEAEGILEAIGISPSTAIEMLYRRVVLERGWPCDLKLPNDVTAKVFHDTDQGKNITSHDSVQDIFDELAEDLEGEGKHARGKKN